MSIRGSIFSISSRMMQRFDDEPNFEAMSLEALQEMQDDLLQKIWMTTLENDVYERFLSRQDPQSLQTITTLLERARISRRITGHLSRSSRISFRESVASMHDFGKRSIASSPSVGSMRSVSRFATPSLLTVGTQTEISRITIAHRMVMARKEVEEMRRKLECFEKFSRQKKATMRAEIEEIEIRINEAHEAKEEFEEEVVVNGVDPITGKIPAERVIRFVEEWLRSANTIIERLRLKSATIRTQIGKAKRQLAQREELGETLRAVDFHKLNIENQDYVKMLEEKSLYVIDMKRIAGHYHLKLTQHKQKLNDLLVTLNKVKEEILLKQRQIVELNKEHRVVDLNVKRMTKQLKNLLNFMENHLAPDILDFVQLQEEYAELKKTHKLLQRRVNIERIMYEEYKKQTHQKKSFLGDVGKRKPKKYKKVSDTIFPIRL